MNAPVAAVSDIPEGSGLGVVVNGHPVALFVVEGAVHAIHNQCPHMDAELAEGELEGCIVICPLHQWEFDVTTGECISPQWIPSARAVQRWPVHVVDGQVHIDIPEEDA